ncbi:NAD(P)/FAD-dependent oxidoreductase [Zoogloea sp.]|uniref:NAD(P)-binding protein n=1 Tax=Zoogloea sp. TaxID=49181 RepID=UPI002611318F|nr:NAD(P)/FAD-dependent oxidoreductase [Zoogloea sp.]MDD3353299.1 NAD(P)-binding protein [Zoogloea sp.]
MRRRSFLAATGSGSLALTLPGCLDRASLARRGIPIRVLRPGMAEGHTLRDRTALPDAREEIHTGVAILGSGIAGLTAAWRLAQAEHPDFLLINGPEPDGNAAGGQLDGIPHPRGAHYLPLPSRESTVVREILAEQGILESDPAGERPRYREDCLVHAPAERLLFAGEWREGLLPTDHVTPGEATQHRRFLATMAQLGGRRGQDGRRVFAVPRTASSTDPAWQALDRQTFAAWLRAEDYTAPSLLAWLDYICRDEYGAGPTQVSAWFGLHYFASRNGQATNAEEGAVLTWPDGLAPLARGLRARIPAHCQRAGTALTVEENGADVRILVTTPDGPLRIRARRVICATPLHVTARLLDLRRHGCDPSQHLPLQAPWLVANFLLDGFPVETGDTPLAWDNVIHGSPGLGWVVATHQWIRAARPARTVFTTYRTLASQPAREARAWLATASADTLFDLAVSDLHQAYGVWEMWRRTQAVEITVRGHGMAAAAPGTLTNPGLAALQAADGTILFAHSDLSGYSVFEEAAHWGDRAAHKVLSGTA